ncbi:hypothetical protein OCOL_001064 [Ordospora colligata]|uniref:Uncharacterized protein n=1 Tax=Ordospora colligata OC4 TaxID=1354746 RepID=A0A0B2UFV0_9MICR|nr:uncharacterized protein M896_041590 [Ordospora colligata OC4]KHN69961.1 hypothetical protein M896_041590 [Ordospora colligata OC4]TBU16131.1 hypothetical protein CWI41_041580 [Ordospora colligata]
MLYTIEAYEKVARVLENLCMSRNKGKKSVFKVVKYMSKEPVYLVRLDGNAMYIVNGENFVLENMDFEIDVPVEKRVTIEFHRFVACMSNEMKGDIEMQWTDTPLLEIDVGTIMCDGKANGTLIISRGKHGLKSIENMLKKFVRIDSWISSKGGIEKSIVNALVLNKMI